MTTRTVVGQRTARAEGPDKVTGRGKYGVDVLLPGSLWLKFLRSPYPHARIVSIDVSKARELPGVHAVLTGEDVRGLRTGGNFKDEPLLAWDRVMFAGDKVAAVAAEDQATAEQALDLIDVEYEELPALLSAEEAAKPDAPILHPDFNDYAGVRPLDAPSNVYGHLHEEKGNVEEGFAEAELIVERSYSTQWVHHAYLEPHACLIWADPQGKTQLWVSSQGPSGNWTELARVMSLPREEIVVNFAYVGGSFGGKGATTAVPVGYLMSKATGRPVKFVMDYAEELTAMVSRHPSSIRIKAGVKRDGTLTAWEAEVYFATGGYAAYAPVPPLYIRGIREVAGPYKIPHVKLDSYQVYTNTVPCGFNRAPGEFQGIFAGESHMDVVAGELGMDPYELRMKNIVHEGDLFPSGNTYQEIRLEETLRAAAEAADYFSPKPPNVGRGIGIGHRSQIGGAANVAVTIHPDGRIIANLPVFDQGVGTWTIVAQTVAEELGVSAGRIQVIPWSSDQGPFESGGLGGSRGARVYSIAGYEAGHDAQGKLRRLAAELYGWTEERINFRDGHLVNQATNERVRLEEVVARAGEPLIGRGDVEEGRDSPYTSFGVQIAEVYVDPETGEVRLLRYTAAQETGQILNPANFHGQIEGGIVYGLGEALMEETVYEDGRVVNPSFADMKIPTQMDIPQLKTIVLESFAGHGPHAVRGIGEHTNIQPAAAIANAVADASGTRIYDLPITSEKVYKALKGDGA